MRKSTGGNLGDIGMPRQDLFDLKGEDLLTTPVDHLLRSADKEKVSVLVDIADVASIEPAGLKDRRIRSRIALVARKDIISPHRDLAVLAVGKGPPGAVHDRNVRAVGLAHRSGLSTAWG